MVIVKIGKNGCLHLPKSYLDILGSDLVELHLKDGKIVLKTVRSLAKSLNSIKITGKEIEEVIQMEKEAAINGFLERYRSD